MKKRPKNREELNTELNIRAWKDPAFKKRLIEDPKAALREFGVEVRENAKVHVYKEAENSFDFILYAAPPHANEMSENDLRKVAGGIASLGGTWCG